MDPVDGSLVYVTGVDPKDQEGEIGKGEEEVEGRELSLAGGEIILGFAIINVVDRGAYGHCDLALRCAVGEEEAVLVGGGDRVGLVEGGVRRRREIAEGEEAEDVLGIKNTEGRVLLELHEDLEERLLGEEEEPQTGGIRGRESGGDGDAGDAHGDVAGMCESEFLEEDHGAGVGRDGQGFDLGGDEGEEEEEDGEGKNGEDLEECEGCFRHCR